MCEITMVSLKIYFGLVLNRFVYHFLIVCILSQKYICMLEITVIMSTQN